ncbi:MAG: hypothetical protein ACYC7F_03125 [Gemmatimonadaceae bacterium]
MTLEEKFWQLYMTPGDPVRDSAAFAHGAYGVQLLDPRQAIVRVVRLAEHIEDAQLVARYRVDGDAGDGTWRSLSMGQTIGNCKLDRVAERAPLTRVRMVIEEFADRITAVEVRVFAEQA